LETRLHSRRCPAVWWWIAFAGIQTLAYVVMQHANLHTNPTPFFFGILLLLPGTLTAFALPTNTPVGLQCGLISGVNLFVWYVCWRVIALIAISDKRS
jgi:hypothetical protein